MTVEMEKENVDENMPPVSESTEMKAAPATTPVQSNEHVFSPELLKMYYARFFPFELLHSWLAYDPLNKNPEIFSKREFSFTIEPVPGEEIYIRYQSFNGEKELKEAICKRQPHKIDIGAVFNHPPKDKNAVPNMSTVQRELVFDIDLTDYDEIRNCGCSGAKICRKCWKFMNMACKVMDEGLREDFGFDRIAWFYSGRRGVHAWICDESARNLSNEARSSVANYFELTLGKKKSDGLGSPLHPMLARAHRILEPMFIESVLPETGHGLLATEDQWEPLLKTLPDAARDSVGANLLKKWSGRDGAMSSPAEKWEELKNHLNILFGKGSGEATNKRLKHTSAAEKERIESWPIEVVFRYTYPRLDINVSKMQNHLLKSPFCVHPKTGRVCVPIQVEKVEEFDPFAVPTLPRLMQELDEYRQDEDKEGSEGKSNKNLKDWQKTSLKEYFEPFQRQFLEPLIKDLRRAQREEAEEQAAMIGDF